jgi:hypothetical protein
MRLFLWFFLNAASNSQPLRVIHQFGRTTDPDVWMEFELLWLTEADSDWMHRTEWFGGGCEWSDRPCARRSRDWMRTDTLDRSCWNRSHSPWPLCFTLS